MFICFAGHGVVNKKKKRIKINVIEKNGFFIVPLSFVISPYPYLKSMTIQGENYLRITEGSVVRSAWMAKA